jgi:hypothetical protein
MSCRQSLPNKGLSASAHVPLMERMARELVVKEYRYDGVVSLRKAGLLSEPGHGGEDSCAFQGPQPRRSEARIDRPLGPEETGPRRLKPGLVAASAAPLKARLFPIGLRVLLHFVQFIGQESGVMP